MLVLEASTAHQADGGDAREENEERGKVAGGNVADAEEQVADGDVEESPQDVDRWRRETFAWRLGKGRGKRVAGDAVDKVGDGVGEERPREEAGDPGVPGHKRQGTGDR